MALILASSHVPTYGACRENCCTPPRTHTTSQVIYLRGAGGLELHLKDSSIDIDNGELIDVDAVFRDAYDQSTFDLYIGCGGCVASEDPIVIEPVVLNGYEPVDIEPFTQTRYRSVFPKSKRKYNATQLSSCPQEHFTIRLVDYKNRSDGSELVWAPVIGLGERFTFLELLEFPIYILRNHGYVWNELGYTYWLWLFIGTPVLLMLLLIPWYRGKENRPQKRSRMQRTREMLYMTALLGFMSAALEELTHLVYVQYGHPIGWGFWVGLFVVIGFAQGIGILFTIVAWVSMYRKSCASSPRWAPLEVVAGFSLFFLFGSGFFIGPTCIMMAGAIRCLELFPTQNTSPVLPSSVKTVRIRTNYMGNNRQR